MVAFTPEFKRENVLTGRARTFLQPYNADTAPVLPANTVPLGGTWPTPWTPVGATEDGLAFVFSRETEDVMIEEQLVPVDVVTTQIEFNLNMVLSEDTLSIWKIAYGGGVHTVQAASSGTPGLATLTISDELDRFAMGFEARNEKGFWRRVLVPIVVSVGDIETTYRLSAARRYETSFRSLVSPNAVTIREMTAAALP